MPLRVTAIPKPFRSERRSLKKRAPAPTEKIGTEAIDKWLEQSEKRKFHQILAGDEAERFCEYVEKEKYDSGDKYPDWDKIENRNIKGDQLVAPDVGHSPKHNCHNGQ